MFGTTRTLNFNQITYFGDSLTDSDEFFRASSAVAFFGIPLTALGYAGKFSNGPVYSELVPGLLGITGGDELNYAVGGAQVLTDRTIAEVLPPSIIRPDATAEDLGWRMDIDGQIARFLTDTVGQDLSTTASSILIGYNDFNDFVPASAETALTDALAYGASMAAAALEDAAALAQAGIGTIILNTLQGGTVFPIGQGDAPEAVALGGAAAAAFNQALETGAAGLEALGAEVIILDFAAIFDEIEANFSSHGFRTLDDPVILPDANGDGLDEVNPAIAGVPLDQIA
ncbi:MAG: SGNH/GDSL hydrolase family protein, partial [Pseudomonadota bacterium]